MCVMAGGRLHYCAKYIESLSGHMFTDRNMVVFIGYLHAQL